jgi:hypothetical protein
MRTCTNQEYLLAKFDCIHFVLISYSVLRQKSSRHMMNSLFLYKHHQNLHPHSRYEGVLYTNLHLQEERKIVQKYIKNVENQFTF